MKSCSSRHQDVLGMGGAATVLQKTVGCSPYGLRPLHIVRVVDLLSPFLTQEESGPMLAHTVFPVFNVLKQARARSLAILPSTKQEGEREETNRSDFRTGGAQPMFAKALLHPLNSIQIRKLRPQAAVCLLSLAAILAASVCNVSAQSTGAVSSWGYNAYGQLGNGANGEGTNSANTNVPGPVSNLLGVTAVTGGQLNSLALKGDGTVWAWGYGAQGELGDGAATSSTAPVQVSILSTVSAIAAGEYHSLALKADGTVWAWGFNLYGQLGNGTNGPSPSADVHTPVEVSNISGVLAIAGAYDHNLALKTDGTVWAWGYNGTGALGNGNFTDSNTPVQISNFSGVKSIAGGGYHSLAVKNDGTVWAWGNDGQGELGDGTNTNRSTPVQVNNLSRIGTIGAGLYHSLASTTVDNDSQFSQLNGGHILNGNQIVNGNVTATNFVGDGAGLTGVTAANSLALGGTPASNYARLNIANFFNGNQNVIGNVAASAFIGDGSALTNIATANFANTAGLATMAGTATNAFSLGNVLAANYARLDIGNNLTGNQAITGNVSATGSLTATGSTTLGGPVKIGGGTPIIEHLSLTPTITVPLVAPNNCVTLAPVTFSGASDGDTIALGVKNALTSGGNLTYFAWVSATNTVSVKVCNPHGTSNSPLSGTIRVDIWKH